MKRKHNEGFTLLETLIAIVVLGVVVVPVCSSLVMSFRINAKAEQLMRDQLAVSSAVETLMAEGIVTDYIYVAAPDENYGWVLKDGADRGDLFPEVKIKAEAVEGKTYY
ncbi:MAG: prepilin-type N-terminal cleavage/methylation domain-containing protein, partial [Clostridia bacterium]|nr:prepilin-type N-terminal cleavage/methylation domain-containing protein [Clostridia bacterium]